MNSIDWLLKGSTFQRYLKLVLITVPLVFLMSYVPSRRAETRQYEQSHPTPLTERIALTIPGSLVIAALGLWKLSPSYAKADKERAKANSQR